MNVVCRLVHLGLVSPECWVCDHRICPSLPTHFVGRAVLKLISEASWTLLGLFAGFCVFAAFASIWKLAH